MDYNKNIDETWKLMVEESPKLENEIIQKLKNAKKSRIAK